MIECQTETEEDKQTMIVVGHTAIQPHAVMIKTSETRLAEFTVLGTLWDYYLQRKGKRAEGRGERKRERGRRDGKGEMEGGRGEGEGEEREE